jgi:hypothetical protein
MRINEIITESEQLEEGWKQNIAAAAMAAGAALGGGYSGDADAQSFISPSAYAAASESDYFKSLDAAIQKKFKEEDRKNKARIAAWQAEEPARRIANSKIHSELQRNIVNNIDTYMTYNSDKIKKLSVPQLKKLVGSVKQAIRDYTHALADEEAMNKDINPSKVTNQSYAKRAIDALDNILGYHLNGILASSESYRDGSSIDMTKVSAAGIDDKIANYNEFRSADRVTQNQAQSRTVQQNSKFSEPPTTSTANGLAFALGVVGRNREFLPDDVITIATRVYNNWKKTATPEMIKKFNTGMNQGAEEWTTQADIDKYAKVIKDYGIAQPSTSKMSDEEARNMAAKEVADIAAAKKAAAEKALKDAFRADALRAAGVR